MSMIPANHAPAPTFTLQNAAEEEVSLTDLRGAPVLLVFYPLDWSPVCGDQLAELAARHGELSEHWVQVVGISVDSTYSHAAYAEAKSLPFPLLADFHPKGAVSEAYGVYNPEFGHTERALFLIDDTGVLRWSTVVRPWENPGVEEALEQVRSLAKQ